MKEHISLVRAKQWVKDAFVLAPPLFSFRFTEFNSVPSAMYAFLSSSFAVGAYYIANDIQDREKNALHPQKKYRPLASGIISVRNVLITAEFLLVAVGGCIYLTHSVEVAAVIALYLMINVCHTGKLKDSVLPDVFVIAIEFVLHGYAGAYAIRTAVSSYIFNENYLIDMSKAKDDLGWGTQYNDTDIMIEAFRLYYRRQGVSRKLTP